MCHEIGGAVVARVRSDVSAKWRIASFLNRGLVGNNECGIVKGGNILAYCAGDDNNNYG